MSIIMASKLRSTQISPTFKWLSLPLTVQWNILWKESPFINIINNALKTIWQNSTLQQDSILFCPSFRFGPLMEIKKCTNWFLSLKNTVGARLLSEHLNPIDGAIFMGWVAQTKLSSGGNITISCLLLLMLLRRGAWSLWSYKKAIHDKETDHIIPQGIKNAT